MNFQFPIILDGAMGTQLQKQGLPRGSCPEKWTLEHPDTVRKLQSDYVAAGAQILYSPTFGANSAMLERHGITGKVADYNRELVKLSKEAAGGKALVAGDISSTGSMLYPMGDKSFEDIYAIYLEQAAALNDAGVDLFVIETMTGIPEARAALLAVKSISDKPVFVSFTCDKNGRTLMGTDVCAALQIMQGMGADVFGLNCSMGPKELAEQVKRLYALSEIPILVKPNAGLPTEEDGKTVYSVGPEEFAGYIPSLAKAGASVFGGCCGTDPDYIAAIKKALDGISVKSPDSKLRTYLPSATEKQAFFLHDAACETIFACDDDLEDNICELDEGEVFSLEIRSSEDIRIFSDVQYCIKNPLCFLCEDAALLEKALRAYQGRALYKGSLSPETLLPLAKKYGLIL